MRSRFVGLAIFWLGFHLQVARADEVGDKLDAILKEIKSLNARVEKLELQVRELKKSSGAKDQRESSDRGATGTRTPTTGPSPRSFNMTPADVIRMQQESPELLLKGVHERERLLRQRPFPPDIRPVPLPIRP